MRSPSRLLAILFLLAAAGVLLALALIVATLGLVPLLVYLALAGLVVGAGIRGARRQVQARRPAAGRTCSCCTTTVHDPVRVV
jgi:hypothetical protein